MVDVLMDIFPAAFKALTTRAKAAPTVRVFAEALKYHGSLAPSVQRTMSTLLSCEMKQIPSSFSLSFILNIHGLGQSEPKPWTIAKNGFDG
uniref:Uncharacterized protein n=1 Tax=Romanomermis culicivorax TaxID=13658 RepID=A0A915KZU0_ROMCU